MAKTKAPKAKIMIAAVIVIAACIYYYIALPAFNIHSPGTWRFLMMGFFLLALIRFIRLSPGKVYRTGSGRVETTSFDFKLIKNDKFLRVTVFGFAGLLVIFIIGSILSSPIINAAKYQQLLKVETGEFSQDIHQITYTQIPSLDRNSAAILGSRKMGSLVDLTSQFVVAEDYSQINYQGKPVRVTPLNYASLIKWFTNQKSGVPGYIMIDMTSQDTELIRLPEGMKYSPYDHFGRNLLRHLRFQYPTYIFDDMSFEINDEGTPYWVCSVAKYNIGLFGGKTIGRVILCNAITGECEDYAVEEAPSWIDRAYSAELLIELYDYYGTLKHGFINSVLGQRDCLQTTNGYNYLALNDDVWVYTGVTSITSDQSNVGFVLMNQRTMETKYYQIEGAIEDSAMASAEGQVQHLNYRATFPLLLNISEEPTYFIALKDAAGLVKKYAMVNVQKYQVVAIGDSISECEKNYIALMRASGIETGESTTGEKVTGRIEKLVAGVIDGNTNYYVMLRGDAKIYVVSLAEHLDILRFEEGGSITLQYMVEDEEAGICRVTALSK